MTVDIIEIIIYFPDLTELYKLTYSIVINLS